MDGNSRLSVPSNLESPLMNEVSDLQQSSGGHGGGLSGSITACKKVLRSNSLLESTDYWLQNQRTPCQIGFVEDKSESCASVCFVNLDVNKDASDVEHLRQKLVNVSPDLPKLINSMTVQQPKENEIVLLSGLASGNLQADFDVSQCPWLSDICLVQCARGSRRNSTNCIIFEINKFLIGLELVQERQLPQETGISKLEDDTNCSLSSIEEDFLTASEHLEEESEVEDYKNSYENINVPATVVERKKPKKAIQEEWEYQEKLHCSLEDKYVSTFHTSSIKSEASQESNPVGRAAEENLNPPASPSQWKGKAVENEQPTTNYCYPESFSVVLEQGSNIKPKDAEDMQNSPPPIQNGEVTTGEYATNLAESVLQDAFIRLSRSQPTPLQESSLLQESATGVSIANTVLPSGCYAKDLVVPRSWNELPKIVIVQSSDGSDVALEPGVSSWTETEGCAEVPGILSGESSNRHPQSALEVALACAATVIGTISSPQATERLTMEQESLVSNGIPRSSVALQTQVPSGCKEPSLSEYSFPSALCGMTQVASAVAVCGLGEPEEGACPVAPGGLLPTAGAAEPMPTVCSLVAPGKEAIAQALLAEAALVLARPDAYSSIDNLLESVSQRITEATSKSRTLCLENVLRNELAQTLSNIILKHSMDEVHQRNNPAHRGEGRSVSETLDAVMQSVNQLLHSVMCLTFKKMSHMAQLTECPAALSQETLRWTETDPPGFQLLGQATGQAWTKVTACSSGSPLSKSRGAGVVLDDLVTDLHEKQDMGRGQPGLIGNLRPQYELSCGHRALDSSTAQTFSKEIHPKGMVGDDTKTLHQTPSYEDNDQRAPAGKVPRADHCDGCVQHVEDGIHLNPQGKNNCVTALSNDAQVTLSLLGEDLVFPAQSLPQAKHSDVYSGIADFAEDLAETVVSMATEIAAICLDNSNGKQPWFCAWKRGNEFLVTPNGSCRSLKRKKETLGGGGSTVRKHKPPRLSEIKRKTDEHPELKEKLMNRVMDESVNLEDVPDSVDVFANEVAAKIMSLTEFSTVDGVWQAQGCSRNRLLGGDRWNRLKASSCESIPEEDSEVRGCANSLGLMSTLSRPVSRASSVSKQSSCESITEEFSRFMVNQMENEGRGFELLLDYYAGKNASSIVSSAVRQVCQPNDHLSVRPSCPSKQSSTESITEEFYRYMLRDIERESKDGALSRRGSHDWTAGLLSPSARSPLCYRQSSVPDSRTSCSRLTVNAPIKANSLDGFAQHCPQDFLSVQPVPSVGLSSGLCKSDTCLYRRGGTDQITNMLIHETWASSIEALMRKNKIIVDDNEERAVSGNSPLKLEKRANGLAAGRACKGPTLLVQESIDHPRKDVVSGSKHSSVSSPSKTASVINLNGLDSGKEAPSCHESSDLSHPRKSLCSRDVPLIQIETDQREECIGEPEPFFAKSPVKGSQEHQRGETSPGVARSRSPATGTCETQRNSTASRDAPEAEVSIGAKAPEEFPSPPSSSEDSTGSWSQLVNEDDNPDDTSSFLQLSERSMSNGNSSATSSVGIMDLDIYQESMPSSPMTNELVEEKESLKEHSESIKEHASGLPARTTSPQKSLLVINFDLEPECPDAELRATLQWIAASELGIPTIYFKKSQESRIEKFLDVVQLVHQKSWKVGDIFHAVVQYCKMHAEKKEGTPSLFDWLLELG